ncbi:MAG TPA: response regulator [Terriglobales bacterium]|nr:response regulator [Terriglobales bacterium]
MALKILLADDSMTAQNMGKKILVDAGYEVLAVSNGAAAIKKIAADRPDLIILDVYMPGYTGLEVCERVKGAPDTARIPVLLTVGKMEPFRPEEANRVRADGVMIKPFEATDLLAAVQSIGNKQPSSTVRTPPPPRPEPEDETTVRIPPQVASLVDTLPIPPPKAAVTHEDTVPIPPPTDADATLRLTPEQVRAFQDQSYREWMAIHDKGGVPAAEAHTEEAAPEMSVAPPAPAVEVEPAIPAMLEPEMPVAVVYAEPEAPAQPFFAVEPAMEVPEPVPVELVPPAISVTSHEEASMELETSAPIMLGDLDVAKVEELETTIASPTMEVAIESAPELEINSPIHLQERVEVEADSALVTNDQDMSEFVTKFGVEKPEEIAVGVVSDLEPEQLAAITMPVEPAEHVLEATVAEPTSVLDEVGEVEIQTPMIEPEPVVAFVPSLEDTQEIAPFVPAMESAQEEAVETPALEPSVVELEPVAPAVAEEISVPEPPVEAVAEAPAVEAPMHSVEMAVAAAAGVASAVGVGHIATDQTPAAPEPLVTAPVEELQSEAQVALVSESSATPSVGDAELAQQLAAALAKAEAEQPVAAETEAAITASIEPHLAAAVEPIAEEAHNWSDSKLSEAVAKAIEKLKPQLITEILRELIKK